MTFQGGISFHCLVRFFLFLLFTLTLTNSCITSGPQCTLWEMLLEVIEKSLSQTELSGRMRQQGEQMKICFIQERALVQSTEIR